MVESFSQEVKNEICQARTKLACCRIATLYGMICGAVHTPDTLRLDTENPTVAKYYAHLMKDVTGNRKASDLSLLSLQGEDAVAGVMKALGVSSDDEPLQKNVLKCEFCPWSFLKGLFLSCGTVTSPGNAYHLELLLRSAELAEAVSAFLAELGMPAKVMRRRGGLYGVYFKDSETVVDLLGHFGANRAAFQLLDIKIYRDLRNNANRVANCEAANISKTVAASNDQMRAIETIIESGRADELPNELRQTLDLRAAFPAASLPELAAKHEPPITKSGVNHRLKRLLSFAETIRKE